VLPSHKIKLKKIYLLLQWLNAFLTYLEKIEKKELIYKYNIIKAKKSAFKSFFDIMGPLTNHYFSEKKIMIIINILKRQTVG
jgi:hypothetical protein